MMFQSSIESNGCISAILDMASINEWADGTGQGEVGCAPRTCATCGLNFHCGF
jgi:hypothetical protein